MGTEQLAGVGIGRWKHGAGQRSLGEQAKHLEGLTVQLARVSMAAGKPDLTIAEV